jgi:hypothetical protein
MDFEENIFSKQAQLMERACILFENRIKQIEPNQNQNIIEENIATIKVFQVISLKFYKDILAFLTKEIQKNELERYLFLLGNVRTLLDIYARFLHLSFNCRDDDKRALICLAYQLLSYRGRDDSGYKKILDLHKGFLSKVNFSFPENPTDLDFRWIKNKGLDFPSREKLLTKDLIEKDSIHTMGVFKGEKIYEIYSFFSELLHGNPYCYTSEPRNERFWVVSESLMTSAFLIELIDKEILRKVLSKDFRTWLDDVKNSQKDFVSIWKRKISFRGQTLSF